MAAFAIFSNSKEKNIDSYRAFIERLQREAKLELASKPKLAPASSFKYYSDHKNRIQHHVFKEFIYLLSMKMLDGAVGILLCDNPTPTFKFLIRLIERVHLPDGNKANAYYGELRHIVTGFMNYFTTVIDETGKKINRYTHFIDNKQFLELIDETVAIYETNHEAFLRQYQPLNSDVEKEKYQRVIDAQAKFLQEMGEIRTTWEFRQDKFDIFAKKSLEESIQKTSDLFNFAHTYIALMLADRLYEIAVSLEESARRLRVNLQHCKEICATRKNMLILNLYEKNKEQLDIYRRLYGRSTDTAEVNRTMDLLREKISHCGNEETLARLELENNYWNKRIKDFNEIASILIKIQSELEQLKEDRKKYKSIKLLELPGTKSVCFEMIGENIDNGIAYLKEKRLQMSKSIITFFYVRGTDRVMYTDRAGSFFVDEYNHQNYINNYGLKYFHVNCYGEFVENPQNIPYYFDDDGRYTLDENGEKIHQVATCTSQYKVGQDSLLKKITKDCGHSHTPNPNCRLEEIKDPTDKVMLPKRDLLDITGTLDSNSVKFLWDSFGIVLPEVLYEVATRKPKNPIHAMSRLLIKRKFEASDAELRKWKRGAEKYRTDIQKQRKDKAIADREAWLAKQMKRRKPEHYDDYQERYALQQHFDWHLAETLGYYD